MSYESECLDFVDNTYRQAFFSHSATGSGAWPSPPPTGSSASACASWNDTTYIPWYDDPNRSGSNSPPPPPPRKKKN